jgi:ATPase subunit of ABC transporter with duplicated ATPase domains
VLVGNTWSVASHHLSMATNERRLFEAAEFAIRPGAKVALLGRNGG